MTAASATWRSSVGAIVLGASAGGVEALSVLLPALPGDLALPVFVVLHLPRDRPSLLVDIFAPKCAVRVVEAEDQTPIAPGTVYIAPPDYHLLVDAGPRLALSVDDPIHYSRPSIDVLFESAADVYREHLLGIILTGGNEDGAAGLDAVRRAGGMTVVQQPEEAYASLMPASALERGAVDHVWTLARLAEAMRCLGPRGGMA
ncbi:MAG: chemotaxis protein CheB [Proteobacteria bacterium]|nr:chemotaxis protein CheB [Pseudomonadota bacterium]